MNTAHDSVLIDCPDSTRCVVFGLRWFALVGSDIAGKARRRARQVRATHYVIGHAQGAVVGCGRLSLAKPRRTLYAAAQLFAQFHPDDNVACLAELPDGRAWVVASLMGAVLAQTDKLYASSQAAMPDWQALRAQRPMLNELDGRAVLDRVMTSIEERAALMKLRSRWKSLPAPLRVCMVALSLTLAVPPITQRIRHYARPKQIDVPMLDAAAAWNQARQALLRRTPIHDISQLQRAFTSLHELPLQVRGWVLRTATCAPELLYWRCSATYLRVHPMATNESFVQSLPASWTLSFQPLDGVLATWRVSLLAASLADINPLMAVEVNTKLVSSLQRALPVFSGISLGEPVRMEVTAPVGPDGDSIEPIDAVPAVFRRDLILTGPLRSFALLGEVAMVAAWSELSLSLTPERPSTKSQSVLNVQLKGVIYEQAS